MGFGKGLRILLLALLVLGYFAVSWLCFRIAWPRVAAPRFVTLRQCNDPILLLVFLPSTFPFSDRRFRPIFQFNSDRESAVFWERGEGRGEVAEAGEERAELFG